MKRLLSVILSLVMIFSIIPMNAFGASKLPAPTVTLSNVSSTGKIKVSWTKVSGAYVYEVYRATSKNGTYKNMITKSSTSYINTSATAGKTYYYKVRAVSSGGTKGSFSSAKYRTCDLTRPEVRASNSSKGYPKLTWGKITGAESYKVYRATSKTGTYKLMKTTTSKSYTNTSAESGKTYYYKVKAVCSKSAADSAYSTVVSAKRKSAQVIRFGINAECPPFEYVINNGTAFSYDGIDIAVAKRIAADNNMDISIENMEFSDLLTALENNQVDAVISGMTEKPDRKEIADCSVPYCNVSQVMVTRKESNIQKASDMKNKKVVVVSGSSGEYNLTELGYNYTAVNSFSEAVSMLENRKCDVVVMQYELAEYYLNRNPKLKCVKDNDVLFSEEYVIYVKKGNTELLEKINKSISRMKTDGTIDSLFLKYGELY